MKTRSTKKAKPPTIDTCIATLSRGRAEGRWSAGVARAGSFLLADARPASLARWIGALDEMQRLVDREIGRVANGRRR